MSPGRAARKGGGRRFDALSDEARALLVEEPPPTWLEPMKATTTDDRFSDPGWIFEPKLDGYRCLAFRTGGQLRMLSRNKQSHADAYPGVARALDAQPPGDFVVDGELVAVDGDRPDFGLLQRARTSGAAVFFYVFDLLHVDGWSTRDLPLVERKALVREVLELGPVVRLTPHRVEDGLGLYEEMCGRGWEGVIAKRADSRYVPRRSRDWLKFKCLRRQELVIGGFTDPQNSRVGFGALLVGYHDDRGRLVYAGKVGTGFTQDLLAELHARLVALEVPDMPFAGGTVPKLRAHWVRPELVAEIGFGEWTGDGRLRHPRFLGLRPDKAPADVVREPSA